MLRTEIIEAVKRGEFHIWAVETVDQALEILTDISAGKPGRNGRFPEASIHGRASRRIAEDATRLKSFLPNSHNPEIRALSSGDRSN
jgi:hypothetical protein